MIAPFEISDAATAVLAGLRLDRLCQPTETSYTPTFRNRTAPLETRIVITSCRIEPM